MIPARVRRRFPLPALAARVVVVALAGTLLVGFDPGSLGELHHGPVEETAAAGAPPGDVLAFGQARQFFGSLQGTNLMAPVVGMADTPDGGGYWLVAADGGVFTFGDAGYHGSAAGTRLASPVVGMADTPDGGGYWLVAADGGVFTFGDAGYHGSAAGTRLASPVVGMADTPDGGGYWLVAADGGVFTFGDAGYHGSAAGTRLASPVVGMADTPDGGGYWLVAADGGVFTFGDAGYHGSAAGTRLASPVVGMADTPDGGGYWLVAADGGVFTFGVAAFAGSAAGQPLVQPVIGIAPVPRGWGYWLVEGRRGPLAGKVVVIDPGHNGRNGSNPWYINVPVFNGRTEEACDTAGAATNGGYSEAQFNFNVAMFLAADLRAQGATVILTRTTNDGVGPCVTQRAAIGNDARADVALSIHADGGPPGGVGFSVLEPMADGPNNAVIGSSAVFGTDLRDSFLAGTGEPVSNYDGVNGLQPRDDLGGLNLTTVPKVFIECANMRNAVDAARVVNPSWQAQAAAAIDTGISVFLRGR